MVPVILLSLLQLAIGYIAFHVTIHPVEKKKDEGKRNLFKVLMVLCCLGTVALSGLQEHSTHKEKGALTQELKDAKDSNDRMRLEFREKFQTVLIQLNAAKTEDSKKITDEKIRVIQKDFNDWADMFIKNLPKIKGEYSKTQEEVNRKQLQAHADEDRAHAQISQGAYQIIDFTRRYVEGMVVAYGKKASKEVKIDSTALPDSFYLKECVYPIRITTNAVWQLHVGVSSVPCLRIVFQDSKGNQSATLLLDVDPTRKIYAINYSATVPFPDPAKVNGAFEFPDYETKIRETLQPIIETQLSQALE